MFKKFIAAVLSLMLIAGYASSAAAAFTDAVIDTNRTASLTIYKYDITTAVNDGAAAEGSLTATGARQTNVENEYGGYEVSGVVFTYLKIGEIMSLTDSETGQVQIAYGMKQEVAAILDLRAADAVASEGGVDYYSSEDINAALKDAMGLSEAGAKSSRANASEVSSKDSLETLVRSQGTAMSATDAAGRTYADGLSLGLYLVVETSVPDYVDRTAIPFFVSLPMTNADGDSWNYDVFVYPKNETDAPELKKEVREVTTANTVSGTYSDTTTASAGDTVQYQIVSNLPEITSSATRLSMYTFTDTLSKGISYVGGDVVLSWTDADGIQQAEWTQSDPTAKFKVSYTDGEDGAHVMTIEMTEAGLAEIDPVYSGGTCVSRGYSSGTVTITYTAVINTDGSAVLGDAGNPNDVKLEWSRTNTSYIGMLKYRCK